MVLTSRSIEPPREITVATMRLAAAQVIVSMSLPLNASIGTVAAETLSGNRALAGTSVGVAFICSAISLYTVSRHAAHLGRKPIILTGLSLLAAGSVVIGMAIAVGSYPLFLVGTAIFGFGQGPAMLGRAAAADLYPPALRGRGVGTVATGGAVGSVIGPIVAAGVGSLALVVGLTRGAGPFLLVPAFAVVAIALVARLHPDPREIAADLPRYYRGLEPQPAPPPPRSRGELLRLTPVRTAIVATGLAQAAMVGVMGVTALVLKDEGWSDGVVQLLMAAHFTGMFALAILVGRFADRFGRRLTSLVGCAICAIGAIGTPIFANSVLVAPFFFLLGLGWSGCYVAGTAVMADVTSPRERGVLTSLNDMLVAVFAAVAVLSSGVVLDRFGFVTVGTIYALLLLLAVPGLLRLSEPEVGRYGVQEPNVLASHQADRLHEALHGREVEGQLDRPLR